jgi:all-trans-retinol dehydrogenase (NAD+)
VKIVESMGGFCKGYKIDISKKEEVYKAADEIRMSVGDVSINYIPNHCSLQCIF